APGDGWTPAPSDPFDREAGVLCDFAIHAEPIVDEVKVKTLEAYPDGSAKRVAVTGALVFRVTNVETGKVTKADASGEGFVEYGTDTSMIWYSKGPVLLGFREDAGTLPRGLWIVDGLYTVDFNAELDKNVRIGYGRTHNVCDDLD
ncbi:MAG: hypothetical protein ACRDQ2_15215, partial [Gaiellales bacterium]